MNKRFMACANDISWRYIAIENVIAMSSKDFLKSVMNWIIWVWTFLIVESAQNLYVNELVELEKLVEFVGNVQT